MIEVFKTNVTKACDAEMLVAKIYACFENYIPNFDLEDCDKILRVESPLQLNTADLIQLIKNSGFTAEILPDQVV